MRKKNKQFKETDLLPFHILKAASEGDVVAINIVLKHYEDYIICLSTRCIFDAYGNPYFGVDEVLQRRLETRLIASILKFKPVPRQSNRAMHR